MNVIKKQFIELRKKCPYLYLHEEKHCFIIKGTIFIECKDIKDKYEIETNVPDKYPTEIPSVKEIGGKIPKEYHHNEEFLCLETPFTIWEIFRKDETLLNFFNSLILPYLLSYSIFKKSGTKTFEGDIQGHAHGAKGILEDYKKRFNIKDDIAAVKLLQILAEDNYRRHDTCPCGSRKKLKKCHGKYIYPIVINENLNGHDFMNDYIRIFCMLREDNILKDISNYFSEKVKRAISNGKLEEKWGY